MFRSTLVPGTVEDVLKSIIEQERRHRILCELSARVPREDTSIRDYDKPPFTIVGANNDVSVARLRELFGHLPCEIHSTSIRAAEMVKYCCKSFHALKITFADETARLCDACTHFTVIGAASTAI